MTRCFFDFTRSSVSFLRAGLPTRVRAKLKETEEKTKNHIFGYSLVSKTVMVWLSIGVNISTAALRFHR